ncbi:hypothetical protein KW787_01015 [Candidatus Pacearchaeota archaeon]|nr:hypothetical protein [Candidatus Pacearchaeota archaeon]
MAEITKSNLKVVHRQEYIRLHLDEIGYAEAPIFDRNPEKILIPDITQSFEFFARAEALYEGEILKGREMYIPGIFCFGEEVPLKEVLPTLSKEDKDYYNEAGRAVRCFDKYFPLLPGSKIVASSPKEFPNCLPLIEWENKTPLSLLEKEVGFTNTPRKIIHEC